jgi:apolipoprotein N-acyltransferase
MRWTRAQWGLVGLSLVAGVLWFLGCPNFDLWPLSWIAMVPTMVATERATSTRQAFLFAWLTGTVGNAGGFYWLAGLFTRFAGFPWIAALLSLLVIAAYQGLVFALFGITTRAIRRHTPLPMALVAPLAIVTYELLLPVVFPFHVAITQAWQHHLIQVADLTGPLGVSALLLMVNGAVYDVLTERRRLLPAALVSVAVLLGALVYGHVRIRQVERARAAAPTIQVGVVQPNVAFDQKGIDHADFAADQLASLQAQSRALEAAGADLIVWPESSYPYTILRDAAGDFREGSRFRIRDGFSTPLVVGAVTREPGEVGSARYFNSMLLVDREGRFAGRFDKRFLLIMGEYTPGTETFPWLQRYMPAAAGSFTHGTTVQTLPLRTREGREYRLGPMICYEDILRDFGRQLAPHRPHLLVNITNDAWFGDTAEPWEHLALSVFRAVEMRTDLVRSVNTGVSAFVDAAGRVVRQTYAVDPAVNARPADHVLQRVPLLEGGHTVYAAVGDLFGYLCVGATAFLWFGLPRLRRRRAGLQPTAQGSTTDAA